MAQVAGDRVEDITHAHTHKLIRVILLESTDPATLEEFLAEARRFLHSRINILEYTVDDDKLRMILASLREAASSTPLS